MTPNRLQQIHHLIATGKAAEARETLTKLLYKDSSDPQLWWLFAQVPENEDQLYAILDSLVDMPTNPYTGRARAMLARLPYRPTGESVGNLPVPYLARRNRRWGIVAAVVAAMVIVLAVGIGFRIATASGGAVTNPEVAQVLAAPTQTIALASNTTVPTRTPWPTPTTRATSLPTQQPTRTRQATSVPPTPTRTNTITTADLAKVLPELNRSFANRTTTLFSLTDGITSILESGDSLSTKTLETITNQTNEIRKLRNEIMLMAPGAVPTDVRVKIIVPAHTSYTLYADSVLKSIDLQLQMRQAPPKDSTSNGPSTPAAWQEQGAQLARLAETVKSNRQALQTALNNYSMFAAEVVLTTHSSSKAILLTGATSRLLRMAGGKYKVSFRLESAPNPSKVALWLVSENGAGRKVALFDPQKPVTSGTTTIDLKEGAFRIEAEGSSWWVVVLDPQ